MQEKLISFKTAKLAKEKGFNIPVWYEYFLNTPNAKAQRAQTCQNYNSTLYPNIISAPTQSLLQKWLWENYKLWVGVYHDDNNFDFDITSGKDDTLHFELDGVYPYDLPEEALEKGLQEALKLI